MPVTGGRNHLTGDRRKGVSFENRTGRRYLWGNGKRGLDTVGIKKMAIPSVDNSERNSPHVQFAVPSLSRN
ncbi:hypothetical protein VNO80_09083 [Phaseolus coccineus]|uniref:Uncharacterized protein n=1 Tax=Phaseolus coccineus TaxID=3886 RepID=A0AAN9N5N7_PHACN